MPLWIAVRWEDARRDAAGTAGRRPWVPHPALVFGALAAAAEPNPAADGHHADVAALRWLASAGPPPLVLIRPPDTVTFVWPQATPADGVLWRLGRLARRAPYVGSPVPLVEVTVRDEPTTPHPPWVAYRPAPAGFAAALLLRVPHPGYVDQLRRAHGWESCPEVAYAAQTPEPAAMIGGVGPYPELLVWPVRGGGLPVAGDRLLTVTEHLRRAVISRIADPVPAQASGHGADGRPHLAYLPLLDVGRPRADGRLLGLGVAIPGELPPADRMAVLRGLLGEQGEDPIRELRAGSAGVLHLGDPAELPPAWALHPARWCGPPDGVRRWVSVTPVMLDRYPGRRDPAMVLAEGLVTAGYPKPAAVTVLAASPVAGAVRRPRADSIPPGRPRRPLLHCRVEFDDPVRGPVLAGALRYLGCGLLVPEAIPAAA